VHQLRLAGATTIALLVIPALAGCIQHIGLDGFACDNTHACVTGFICLDGTCVNGADVGDEGEGAGGEGEGAEGEGGEGEGEGIAGEGEGEGIAGEGEGEGVAGEGEGEGAGEGEGEGTGGEGEGEGEGTAGEGEGAAGEGEGAAGEGEGEGEGTPLPPDVLAGWADRTIHTRVDLLIDPAGLPRTDLPLSLDVDLNGFAATAGITLAPDSVRVFEHSLTDGSVIGARLPAYVFVDSVAKTTTLIFALSGPTTSTRRFGVYFSNVAGPPPEWQSTPVANPVADGSLTDVNIGVNEAPPPDVLGLNGITAAVSTGTFPGIENDGSMRFDSVEIHRDTPHAFNGVPDPTTQFTVQETPTVLIADASFVLIEEIAGAGNMSIREHTVLVGTPVVHRFFRFENNGSALTSPSFEWVSDQDMNDPGCCDGNAGIVGDASAPTGLKQCAPVSDFCGTIASERPLRSFEITPGHGVFNDFDVDALTNTLAPGFADMSVGASWSLGASIPANSRAFIRIAHAYDTSAGVDQRIAEAMTPVDVSNSPVYVLP
jgi:hypothetical protein